MAGDWIITGGRPLQGRVELPAANNSVLPLLAAASRDFDPVLHKLPELGANNGTKEGAGGGARSDRRLHV